MEEQHLFPEKIRILSGSMLKVIAVVTMLIDHIASHLIPSKLVLFSFMGMDVALYRVMRDIGRIAFPIFVFLLIEGFLHTRNRRRYGINLLVFALISELPWNLVHSGNWFYQGQNVFFTLLLGYVALCAVEALHKRPFIALCIILALCILAVFARLDYGYKGIALTLLMYTLRKQELFRPLSALVLNNPFFSMAAFIPITMYNGKRGFIKGPVLKYAFYLFYPVHLFIIFLFKYYYIRIG